MTDSVSTQLGERLNLPANSLAALSALPEDDMQSLLAAVQAAEQREHGALDQALDAALFWPLRNIIIRFLRRP